MTHDTDPNVRAIPHCVDCAIENACRRIADGSAIEGKLDAVLSDDNFTVETCKSCHPVTGAVALDPADEENPIYDTTELALKTILPSSIHEDMDYDTEDCASCHSEEGDATVFSDIHTGYEFNGLRKLQCIDFPIAAHFYLSPKRQQQRKNRMSVPAPL